MISNLDDFCRMFYNATGTPIGHYTLSSGEGKYFPDILNNESIFSRKLPAFISFPDNPDCVITDSFGYMGCVKSETEDYLMMVGPVYSTPLSDFTLRNFMKEWAIDPQYKEDVSGFLHATPIVSYNRFLQTLSFLFLCINDKSIDIYEHFEFDANAAATIQELSHQHTEQVYESKESQQYHNTWNFERRMLQFIQDGDAERLNALLQSTSSELTEGIVADNALRQRKNILISSIALVTRAAIAGGMDMEQAYQLSDIYIRECERSQSIPYISNLEYSMLIDFAKRVSETKIPEGMSREVFDCVQYITHHINEPIQVSDIADYIGKSRSYLSGRFKKELGFDISSFIMRCKLEEAKSLLTYSDKSLSEISCYLCFSSQSYFQNVFKKKYGMTPRQYREKTTQLKSGR
ncbi:MAG: helix-turn-helix domain-containing protein [Lachnospiraceae bacterium]|nr:helix-turn-helix domain-containing protein [Lachnospiraceae bacterium]